MPEISAVVVHWRGEEEVRELIEAWPRDGRFELLVVDNSSTLESLDSPARLLRPGRNLGFGGGVNFGVAESRGRWVLILNADVLPEADALEALLAGAGRYPEAAGLAPALFGESGATQHVWQLRPLPTLLGLWSQTLFFPGVSGPRREPPSGTAVEQPAGAALMLRRRVLEEVGGLDEGFFPAWFEDVDLARRLARRGHRLLYLAESRWRHAMGASVPTLGYGPFLWIYYRNLCRYLRIHHGALASTFGRLLLVLGMGLRFLLLPLRKPRRALSRRAAASGLWAVALGAAGGWRRPIAFRERFSRREEGTP